MIPAGKVVTEVVGQEKRINEFAVEIPAKNYGQEYIHPVVDALTESKSKTKTVLQILIDKAGCRYNTDYNLIFENSGKAVLPRQILEYFGLNTVSAQRCPVCTEPTDWDSMLYHLQGTKGHKLSTKKTIDLFSQEFWNWRWYNGRFEKD